MKAFFIKDNKISELLKKVKQNMGILFIDKLDSNILYGSFARHENTDESDIDIMVLVDEDEETLKKYEDKVTDIMVDLSLEFDKVVSLYIESKKYYAEKAKILPFFTNIENVGIKL